MKPENSDALYTIETERLTLLPLTAEDLSLLSADVRAFENNYALSFEDQPFSDSFRKTLRLLSEKMVSEPYSAVFYTVFLIILKNRPVVVGTIDFKNVPGPSRTAEIGYSLGPKHVGCGYMTEAVTAFSDFALSELGIKTVIAETETGNVKSENVLSRAGFCVFQSSLQQNFWKKE